ncbi:MAG TPA: protease inhibitor I42 family protein [Candidatus Kryptonia bacterium]
MRYTLIVSVLLITFVGCNKSGNSLSPTEPKLDSTISGKTLAYSTNQRFLLELDLSADAGYQWDYSVSDSIVARIDSTNYRPKSGNWNQVGGLTVESFFFRTMKPGTCLVVMVEHRGWEPNVPPIDSLKFFISVQ